MRLLALETTSSRGSVALVEGSDSANSVLVSYHRHEEANRQAERLLSLVEAAFSEAKWDKKSLDRVAVGIGPGSFTGVRIGIAQAQGLTLGLGVSGVGVGSLRIIANGVPKADQRLRVVIRDARRDEFFLAAYDCDGCEVVPPQTIPQKSASDQIAERFFDRAFVVVGTALEGLPSLIEDETGPPDARPLARLALSLDLRSAPVVPCYLRGPRVVRPNLAPSPLLMPRQFTGAGQS